MKEQLPRLYAEYGAYINEFRAFPLILDGLKIVERRLLYSLYELAKQSRTKSAKIVGHCIGNYHPHGDVSTYAALVSMVRGGMAEGHGNWGKSVGVADDPPAAQRYTEVKSSRRILDMAFEYIDYVPMEELELDKEPVCLSARLPLCLINLNNCQGIGFGYKTTIPSYTEEDLVSRLKWLLNNKEGEEPIIKPISDCTIKSDKATLRQLLTTGKAKLEFQGICEINPTNKSVIVRAVPPNRSCRKLLEAFQKEIEIEKSIAWNDESTDVMKFRLKVLRQRGYPIEKLVKKVVENIKGSLTYECNMTNTSGQCILMSIDQMLITCYNNYKSIVEVYLQKNIQKLMDKISELEIIQKVKHILPDILRQYPNDPLRVISEVSASISVEGEIVKKLFDKYTISRLLNAKVDIESVTIDKQKLENDLTNIETYIWQEKYERSN